MKFLSVVFLTIACLFTISEGLINEPWIREDKVSNAYGCKYAVSSKALYCSYDTTKTYKCQCKDVVAQGAFVYCGVEVTKNKTGALENFLDVYNEKCADFNKSFTLSGLEKIYNNVTKYIKTKKEYGSYTLKTDILRTPIKYNETIFEYASVSYYRRYQNESRGIEFGFAQIGYWFFVVFVGFIYQISTRLFPSINKNATVQKIFNGVWVKTYKQPIKIFGIELGLIPNRLESLVLAGSAIIFIVGAVWGYRYHPNDIVYPKRYVQLATYVAARISYMALFSIYLTFLFAGRNNFFLWATGWNFSGFLLYHRFVARVTVLFSFAHGMLYVCISINKGVFVSRNHKPYYIWGSLALSCCMFMAAFGNYYIRKKVYDIFLAFHIFLAVFFLIGVWLHLVVYDIQYYCYATVGIWLLDRIIRASRMYLLFGGFRKNKITIIKHGAELDPEDIYLRIDIDNYNKSLFKVKDGNFAFVYILHPRGFWQSHPFTIIKMKESSDFAVVIKVKKGLTKQIFDTINKSGQTSKYYRVCVEGPYGMTKDSEVSQFENLSVITVGTGLSGPLCYLNHHRTSQINEKSGIHNVLHWGVRSMGVVEAYKKELTQLVSQGNVKINIYCNRMKDYTPRQDSNNLPSSESVSEEKSENAVSSSNNSITESIFEIENIELITDYMSVEQIINSEMENTSSLIFMTCGLPAICDESRYHFLKALSSKKGDYHFIDDSQAW